MRQVFYVHFFLQFHQAVDKKISKCSLSSVPNYEPPEEIQTDNPLDHNSDKEIITQGNENKPNICLVEPSVTTSTITNGSPPVVPFETVELQSSHDECNDSEMTIEDEIKIDTTDLKNEQLDPDDSMLETIDLTDDADDKEDARKGRNCCCFVL